MAGGKLENEDVIHQLLGAMPPEFDSVVSALDILCGSKQTEITLDYVRNTLLAEEERILKKEGSQPHNAFSSNRNQGTSTRCVIRNKRRLPEELILDPLYLEPLKMSNGKISNLILLSKFVTKQENRDFFLQFAPDAPVSDGHINDDDNVEIEDDDNSEGCDE
ncbi:unnamed protein product [Pieris macdunnoughi]|uniref:Uncharacterized protein n=1 Tax=Pieris macdunnoughi TaxID=345717 RepID=A0A821WZ32_9NEOP|nr:unnamed protein product [Pieris macdunnoughi]